MKSGVVVQALAGCALAAWATSASATTTLKLYGNTVSSGLSGTDNIFNATIVYDDQAALTSTSSPSGATTANYNNAIQSIYFTSGYYYQTFTSTQGQANDYQIVNSTTSNYNDVVNIYLNKTATMYMQAVFRGLYTTIDTNSLIDPSAFAGSGTNYFYTNDAQGYSYTGKITAFSVNGVTPGMSTPSQSPSVPEPATWGMMILGFGMIGFGMRNRQWKVGISFR